LWVLGNGRLKETTGCLDSEYNAELSKLLGFALLSRRDMCIRSSCCEKLKKTNKVSYILVENSSGYDK